MIISKRRLLVASAGLAADAGLRPLRAQTTKMRFGVGPLLPSPSDTVKAYTPIFDYLAKQLGVEYSLVSTTDWAGMAVAMGSGQLDLAWMGPWGYIIANNRTDCTAIATAKYEEKPTYLAIIIGKPDLTVANFPDDTKGLSMSFADVGSTSGWLIPTYYAKEVWKIDPKTFWAYHEGSTHAANEVAVSSGQVDLATDFDRNRNAMIESGRVKPDANKIVWTPLSRLIRPRRSCRHTTLGSFPRTTPSTIPLRRPASRWARSSPRHSAQRGRSACRPERPPPKLWL
jgi:phosphonate transport system substrate-binding protein